jgi:hypothetical protein
MKIIALLAIYGFIYLAVIAYNKHKNDNFNPYKK